MSWQSEVRRNRQRLLGGKSGKWPREACVAIAELLLRGDLRTASGRPPVYASDSVFLGRAAERVIFTPLPMNFKLK